jgi:hypothetical protein
MELFSENSHAERHPLGEFDGSSGVGLCIAFTINKELQTR